MGVFPYRPRFGENGGGRSFPRAFERRVKFLFYQTNLYDELERHVKEGSGNWQLSP
jgi:hypothetical protein